MGEPQKHYTKLKKPATKDDIPHDTVYTEYLG